MDYCCKFDQGVAAEDGVVGVVDVDHIENYCFGSLGYPFAESDIELYLAKSFDSLASETDEQVLRLLQGFFCEIHLDEALPYQDICGAPVIHQDSPYIIPCEVYWILADVSPDDEGLIMGVMLQLKICLCEGYRNMRPRSSEALAFAHMRDSSEVFFALSLRLVHWFVGSSGDGIDDVNPAAGGCVACSLWYLPRLQLQRWG